MNSVNITGNLTHDPEIRKTAAGTSVCSFTLAVNRAFKKEGQPDADFVPCRAFGNNADFVGSYARKGDGLAVKGEMRVESYQAQDGAKKTFTYVMTERAELTNKRSARTAQVQTPEAQIPARENTAAHTYHGGSYNTRDMGGDAYSETLIDELSADDLPF